MLPSTDIPGETLSLSVTQTDKTVVVAAWDAPSCENLTGPIMYYWYQVKR